jgi:pimeloyl-ACP methyl ester carboxylesterase
MSLIPNGVPLVLLNAFPLDRQQWEPMLAALAAERLPRGDVITFDMPGIGEMPLPDDEPSLDLIADAATSAMRDVTGEHAAVWAGCSMGGYVAMAVAERHPDAIAGLVLIGTKASADAPEARAKRLALAESLDGTAGAPDPRSMAEPLVGAQGLEREALVAWVAENISHHAGDGIAWGQRAMARRPDRLAVLEGLEVPAAVARGEADKIATAAEAEAMAHALGTAVETLEGVGHLAALEAPSEVARLVAEVLAAAEARRSS